MIKLLYNNYKITTIELKDILQLEGNSFRNNLNSLQKDGLVVISKELAENGISNSVELKEGVREKYEEFTKVMIEFLDEVTHY